MYVAPKKFQLLRSYILKYNRSILL